MTKKTKKQRKAQKHARRIQNAKDRRARKDIWKMEQEVLKATAEKLKEESDEVT